MRVSILVVDDEPDAAELFSPWLPRETRSGTYVMRFADRAEAALSRRGCKPRISAVLTQCREIP